MSSEHPHNPAGVSSRPAFVGWSIAVMMVLLAWVAACSMRTSEKVAVEGWTDGLEAGMAQAQATERPMIVMFTADWCGPCQDFKRDVLADGSVKKKLTDAFVPVLVDLTDMSSSNPNAAAARQYGVSGIPALFVMSPSGEAISKYRDGRDLKAFKQWLDGLSQDELAAN